MPNVEHLNYDCVFDTLSVVLHLAFENGRGESYRNQSNGILTGRCRLSRWYFYLIAMVPCVAPYLYAHLAAILVPELSTRLTPP